MANVIVGETAQYAEIVDALDGLKELRIDLADWAEHKHTLDEVGLLLLSITEPGIIEGVEPCRKVGDDEDEDSEA
jgi:hypothetical protein